MQHEDALDAANWQLPSSAEMVRYYSMLSQRRTQSREESGRTLKGCDLTRDFQSVVLYCYLKSRFGHPNGMAMRLGQGGTDELYHWHYTLIANGTFLDIQSTQNGVDIWIHNLDVLDDSHIEFLKDKLRNELLARRTEVKKERQQLEPWTIFINPYQRLNEVVKGLEARASEFDLRPPILEPMTIGSNDWNRDTLTQFLDDSRRYGEQLAEAQTVGLSIKTIVPIWIEAFINLAIFVLARDDIRNDSRMFDSFLRQHIDVRVKMMPNNCVGFAKPISGHADEFKNFHRLYQSRNDLLHGNINVDQLQVDHMFFDEMVPLYEDWKSDYERRLSPTIKFIEPENARQDIVNGSEFIIYLMDKLEKPAARQLWAASDCKLLGYRKDTKRVGILFSDPIVFIVPGMHGDDQG